MKKLVKELAKKETKLVLMIKAAKQYAASIGRFQTFHALDAAESKAGWEIASYRKSA